MEEREVLKTLQELHSFYRNKSSRVLNLLKKIEKNIKEDTNHILSRIKSLEKATKTKMNSEKMINSSLMSDKVVGSKITAGNDEKHDVSISILSYAHRPKRNAAVKAKYRIKKQSVTPRTKLRSHVLLQNKDYEESFEEIKPSRKRAMWIESENESFSNQSVPEKTSYSESSIRKAEEDLQNKSSTEKYSTYVNSDDVQEYKLNNVMQETFNQNKKKQSVTPRSEHGSHVSTQNKDYEESFEEIKSNKKRAKWIESENESFSNESKAEKSIHSKTPLPKSEKKLQNKSTEKYSANVDSDDMQRYKINNVINETFNSNGTVTSVYENALDEVHNPLQDQDCSSTSTMKFKTPISEFRQGQTEIFTPFTKDHIKMRVRAYEEIVQSPRIIDQTNTQNSPVFMRRLKKKKNLNKENINSNIMQSAKRHKNSAMVSQTEQTPLHKNKIKVTSSHRTKSMKKAVNFSEKCQLKRTPLKNKNLKNSVNRTLFATPLNSRYFNTCSKSMTEPRKKIIMTPFNHLASTGKRRVREEEAQRKREELLKAKADEMKRKHKERMLKNQENKRLIAEREKEGMMRFQQQIQEEQRKEKVQQTEQKIPRMRMENVQINENKFEVSPEEQMQNNINSNRKEFWMQNIKIEELD